MMTEQSKDKRSVPFLHPASGALILGADWLFFSGTAASGGFGLPASMGLGFLSGLIGVTGLQRYVAGENWGKAAAKGLLSGMVVGLPFPIGGTVVGGAVLASSGLTQLRERAARKLLDNSRTNKETGRRNVSPEEDP